MNSEPYINVGEYTAMTVNADGQTFETQIKVGLRTHSKKFVMEMPPLVSENDDPEDFTLQGVIDQYEARCDAYSRQVLGRIAVPKLSAADATVYVQDNPATRAKIRELQDSIAVASAILLGIATSVNPEQYLLNISNDWQPPADDPVATQAVLPFEDNEL